MNTQSSSTHAYPHGDSVCAGCHACQPERFPNTSACYCGCHVCNPTGAPFAVVPFGNVPAGLYGEQELR